MAANILLLVGTVLLAISEVFLLCLAGYILGRMDILNKQTRKQINRLNTSIFTPALLFTKVAFSLTGSQLKQLWIIPILFILITSVSAGVAYLMGMLLKVKPAHRNFAMAAAMFMNSNSLPIALMQSLIGTVTELKWTDDDTQSSMLARALTYLVIFSTLGNVARWSFGVKILERADDTASEKVDEGKQIDLESQHPSKYIMNNNNPTVLSLSRPRSDITFVGDTDYLPPRSEGGRAKFYISEEPARSEATLPGIPTEAVEPTNPHLPLSTKSSSVTLAPFSRTTTLEARSDFEPVIERPQLTQLQRFTGGLKRYWKGFCEFMTAPLWAAFLSIIIALIPPVQDLISNHMPPVRQALEMAGNCSIPLTLVVLGAYFYTPPPKGTVVLPFKERLRNAFQFRRRDDSSDVEKEKSMRPGEKQTIFIAIIARQLLCPLVMIPFMLLFVHFDAPKVFTDPVFIVSNVLLVSAPVALTLAQMSSKTGASDGFERLLSTTIFYAYCVVLTPVTIIYVVLGLIIAKM